MTAKALRIDGNEYPQIAYAVMTPSFAKELTALVKRERDAAYQAGSEANRAEREAIMKHLGITFDPELGAEGAGYEAPAEPEPQYFATLAEAVEFEFKLVTAECDKLMQLRATPEGTTT